MSGLVTIVIPVYNGANYLAQAIDSALEQTYADIEVLVINDGSTDDGATDAVARRYGDRIRYVVKPNGGVASALNEGIAQMRGEWFSWLSHDDLYLPEKVALQVEAYMRHGGEPIIYCRSVLMRANGRTLCPIRLPRIPEDGMACFLTESSMLNGCALLIRKRQLEAAGGFRTDLKVTQDYELWFRLAQHYAFIPVDRVLVKTRVHAQQCTHSMRDVMSDELDTLLTHFLNSLTPEQICRYRPRPVVFYEKVLRRSKVNKLPRTQALARTLCRQYRNRLCMRDAYVLYPKHRLFLLMFTARNRLRHLLPR